MAMMAGSLSLRRVSFYFSLPQTMVQTASTGQSALGRLDGAEHEETGVSMCIWNWDSALGIEADLNGVRRTNLCVGFTGRYRFTLKLSLLRTRVTLCTLWSGRLWSFGERILWFSPLWSISALKKAYSGIVVTIILLSVLYVLLYYCCFLLNVL